MRRSGVMPRVASQCGCEQRTTRRVGDGAALQARGDVIVEGARDAAIGALERAAEQLCVAADLVVRHERQELAGERQRRRRHRAAAQRLEARHLAIDVVAAERLVGAFAGEHDGDLFLGAAREEVERHAGGIGDRLVEVPDDLGQRVGGLAHGDAQLAVLGAERLGGRRA